jgi:Asp-tRNA(Asn)/Glu-tRNA(Gln) amidotransferase A subunit family amidase
VLAWPTIAVFPTRIDGAVPNTRRTNIPVNLAGHPSLALPAPTGGPLPASVQLVGPDRSEALLGQTALVLEGAARTLT